jgi:tyrosyl-tRNA synthetase
MEISQNNINKSNEVENNFNLITKGLQEVIDHGNLLNILKERNLKLYWGTATTGKPHVGYLNPLLKICHFLMAGCEVTILFANLHAYLDAMKSTWEQLEKRTEYYEKVIISVLELLGAPTDKIKFVKGTDFQLSEKYTLDVYKLMSNMSLRDANKAGAEVVKQSKNPKMSSLMYPGLQALDEEYLNVDAQFGGIDQRKIFMLSDSYLPKLGYKKRIHLMNPMIPSFNSNNGEKMSSSALNSKIDFLDSAKSIKKKINKAFCEEGNIDCGLFKFIEFVVFPILDLKNKKFNIDRDEKYGGSLEFNTFENLKDNFLNKKLHPCDLKLGVIQWLISFLEPLRLKFNNEDMKNLLKIAYP